MGSIAMYVARIAASRADWGARNRLCFPRARITHCCRFRRTGGTPGMGSAGYAASADRSCLVTLSRIGVPPVPRCTCTMPCRTSWTLTSTAVGTLRGRSGSLAHARPSQRRRARAVRSAGVSHERGGQSVTIDSAILTTSSQSRKGASMPAASAGVIPPSSSCGRKRL